MRDSRTNPRRYLTFNLMLISTAIVSRPLTAAPAREDVHFKWIIANNIDWSYSTTVEINGKSWASYGDGSGVTSKPLPFKDGDNQIKIIFTPQPNATPKHLHSKASLKLILSPSMLPDSSTLTLLDGETESGFEQTDIEVKFAKDQPGKIQTDTKNWDDAEHKRLSFQITSDGDAAAENWEHRNTKVWNPDGKLISESIEKDGKLVSARDYKPDGSVGAEVQDGSGVVRKFFDGGITSSETQYKKGVMEGEAKEFYESGKVSKLTHYSAGQAEGDYREYDEQGKVQVSGSFKADMKTGIWIRYDAQGKEAARSEFVEDKLVKGKDMFN